MGRRSGGGGHKLDKLKYIKMGLRGFNTVDKKHKIQNVKPIREREKIKCNKAFLVAWDKIVQNELSSKALDSFNGT